VIAVSADRAKDREDGPPRRRTVEVYCYSQTGQLRDVADAFVAPLRDAGWEVRWGEVTPVQEFPFPWPIGRFFGIFPEAVDPAGTVDIVDLKMPGDRRPDLVVFAFQVWYLAPSLPMRTVLHTIPQYFAGCDVVGLVACRNMWYSAALQVRWLFETAGARYLGTVAATDTAPTLATIVTTLRWLLTGRREAFWRFPLAGVNEAGITRVSRIGEALSSAVPGGGDRTTASVRIRQILSIRDAAPVDIPIAAADLAAGHAFRRWSRAIQFTSRHARPIRPVLLVMFAAWLGITIVVGLPALALLRLMGRAHFDRIVGDRIKPVLATVPQESHR
jgi:hypothetical protein